MSTNTVYNLKPVIPRPQDTARLTFNLKVVGLTESRIQSYWAQMRFAGRRQPPQEFSSVEERIRFVQNNINTVTYLQHDAEIPEGLTVIYETK